MPLTSSQKAAMTHFVSFTQADKKVAEKVLKQYDWNVQQAVDSYFNGSNRAAQSPPNTSALNKIFDKYREDPQDQPNVIGTDGTMAYFGDLNVQIDAIGPFIVSEILNCPTLGEITREGFLSGWARSSATTIAAQRTVVANLNNTITKSEAGTSLFKRVYKHAFKLGCPPGSKSVPLDSAIEFWKLLFGPQGQEWTSKSGIQWLDMWENYLITKWKKSVNKDMWDQLLLFKDKVVNDETLSFWSEEAAWPGVIDEFVLYAKQANTGADVTMAEG